MFFFFFCIQYRDSTLTFLLSRALSGNARVVILATISPCLTNHYETMSTLMYCKLAKPPQRDVAGSSSRSGAAAATAAKAGSAQAIAAAAKKRTEMLNHARSLVVTVCMSSSALVSEMWASELGLREDLTTADWKQLASLCHASNDRNQSLCVALALLLRPDHKITFLSGRHFLVSYSHEAFVDYAAWHVDLSRLTLPMLQLLDSLTTALSTEPARDDALFNSRGYQAVVRWICASYSLAAFLNTTLEQLGVAPGDRRIFIALVRSRDTWALKRARLGDAHAAIVSEVLRLGQRDYFAAIDLSENEFTDAGITEILLAVAERPGCVGRLDITGNPAVSPTALELAARAMADDEDLDVRFSLNHHETSREAWLALAASAPPRLLEDLVLPASKAPGASEVPRSLLAFEAHLDDTELTWTEAGLWPKGDSGAAWIAAFVPHAQGLVRLDLTGIGMGDRSAGVLASSLVSSGITTLCVAQNRLTDLGVSSLITVSRNYGVLTLIDFTGNPGITAQGWAVIVKALAFRGTELPPDLEEALPRHLPCLLRIMRTLHGLPYGTFSIDRPEAGPDGGEEGVIERFFWDRRVANLEFADLDPPTWCSVFRLLLPIPELRSEQDLLVAHAQTVFALMCIYSGRSADIMPRNPTEKSIKDKGIKAIAAKNLGSTQLSGQQLLK